MFWNAPILSKKWLPWVVLEVGIIQILVHTWFYT